MTPRLGELWEAYLLCRDLKQTPDSLGLNVPRRLWLVSAKLFALAFQGRALVQQCPLMGGGD